MPVHEGEGGGISFLLRGVASGRLPMLHWVAPHPLHGRATLTGLSVFKRNKSKLHVAGREIMKEPRKTWRR